ncbi:YceD family protein [Brevibacillus marinus]|uniref:YceD family protein n=1 Tax=Brevibacillus marinus TaxID=2496837 RepID=UPI000F833563|nr:YceD family protein [Brevibacillus marinus]
MNLKLSDLKHREGEPLPFRSNLDPTELTQRHQEIRSLSPVEVVGEAGKAGELYYVNGELKAEVEFACARCLKRFREQVVVPFAETFAPADARVEWDEDSEIHQLQDDEIELVPVLEEDFLLAMPAFPICAQDCLGLCPTCGVNRNEQTCSCKNERIDPRLAGLADFFKDRD